MTMKKEIGKVSISERDEIESLFERRNGLNESAETLSPENEALYEKLVQDISETTSKFQGWWDKMAKKYQWESSDGGHWEIDFRTCVIYLVTLV